MTRRVVSAEGALTATEAKASGVVIQIEIKDFVSVVEKMENALVIMARTGIRGRKYQYLTSYKSMIFVAESDVPLQLPNNAEFLNARRIWVPW